MSGGAQFRTAAAATLGVEGSSLAGAAVRDFGLLASTTHPNVLVEVMLLFSVNSRLDLPLALEIEPPSTFVLDSVPWPLHPALTNSKQGINPFRSDDWQTRLVTASAEAESVVQSGQELYGIPCPLFELSVSNPLLQHVAMPPGGRPNGSICEEPPTLESSLLETCQADTYRALPSELTRCVVLSGKAMVILNRKALSSYQSSWERDRRYCSRFVCDDAFDHAWLPAGQYRLTVRGYNPPLQPADNDNMWTLTITHEVPRLGGGPRSTIEPIMVAEAPGYRVGASATYSDRISPGIGGVVRGGLDWFDDGTRLPAVPVGSSDITHK